MLKPLTNLQHISISLWYSGVLYASQVLKVVKNDLFWFISTTFRQYKSMVGLNNPKQTPIPKTLVIRKYKNINILILERLLFLTFFPCIAMQINCKPNI